MCGICGAYGLKDKKLLKRMCDVIEHRGPDDEGQYLGKNIMLGHRRLSIIDLKSGKQPIYNENKSVAVVYNGEIYNYKELTDELQGQGHKFRTKTDTEVIVHAYEEYGEEFVKKFNGMFAFALWDKKKERLIIARDRIGIKPVYYLLKDGMLLFGSEIKSILQYDEYERKMDSRALVDYMTFLKIPDNKTFYNGIKKLMPGQVIVIDKKGMKISKYWDLGYKDEIGRKEALREFRETLTNSVKRHMISDVPVGCYQSGGFDSSSVVVTASKIAPKMKTFTGVFKEKEYDESKCSRVVAKQIKADMYESNITPNDFKDVIEKVIYHLDEPTESFPDFSRYCVAKLASEHVKVVLTGHGGDELFAGYPVHKVIHFKDGVIHNPLQIFMYPKWFGLNELPRVLYYSLYNLYEPLMKYGLMVLVSERERKKLFTKKFYDQIKKYDPGRSIEKITKNMSRTVRLQYVYMKIFLQSLLISEDKMSMAHSVEGRTPLLDNKIVELSQRIGLSNKLYGGELKHIVKEAMKGKLPKILYKQPKKGFPTPMPIWLRNELKEYAYELLLSERSNRGIFRTKYVKELLDKHCARKTDNYVDLMNALKIWSLICVELWFRVFIEDKKQ